MNLALTYASKTHHSRLARHINELIQKRQLEDDFNGDDEDLSDREEDRLADQFADEDTDHLYAQSRSASLNQRPQATAKPPGAAAAARTSKSSRSETMSKFNRYMEEIKQGKFLSASVPLEGSGVNGEGEVGGDVTKELFTDSEGEGEHDGGELNGKSTNQNADEDGDSVTSDVRSDTPPPSSAPLATSFKSSGIKRPNPFKVCTIVVDIRLDCIIYMYMSLEGQCTEVTLWGFMMCWLTSNL